MLISTQLEVVVQVSAEQDVAVVESGADLQYTFLDGTDYDGLRTGRSDNNAISALRCSCS